MALWVWKVAEQLWAPHGGCRVVQVELVKMLLHSRMQSVILRSHTFSGNTFHTGRYLALWSVHCTQIAPFGVILRIVDMPRGQVLPFSWLFTFEPYRNCPIVLGPMIVDAT